jgi:hypothetical protein
VTARLLRLSGICVRGDMSRPAPTTPWSGSRPDGNSVSQGYPGWTGWHGLEVRFAFTVHRAERKAGNCRAPNFQEPSCLAQRRSQSREGLCVWAIDNRTFKCLCEQGWRSTKPKITMVFWLLASVSIALCVPQQRRLCSAQRKSHFEKWL